MLTDNRCVALGRHYGCSCHDNGDALARRVAELEAALKNFTRDGFAMGECFCSDHWKGRDIGGHSPECLQARAALASSGGTGAGLREIVERAVRETMHHLFPREAYYVFDHQVEEVVSGVLAGERDVVRRSFETLAATRDESGVAGRDVTAGKSGSHAPLVSPTTDSPAPPSREQEPERWRCQECGAEFDADQHGSHGRADHHPNCDGSCRNCPVEVQCGPVEQAGRADSSASDVERARRFFNSMKPTVWPHVGEVAALAAEFAAIRREAIEECREIARCHFTGIGIAQKIEAAMDALAGDAPAERGT